MLAGLAGGAALLASVSCGGDDDEGEAPGDQPAPSGDERKSLTIADPFEPAVYIEDTIYPFRDGVAECLIRVSYESTLEPGLATAWMQEEPTRWRVTLREGVRFHDGSEVTPDDVVFALERQTGERGAFEAFRGAQVSADGSDIVITTQRPVPFMPALLAEGSFAIYKRSSYEEDPATALPIGTGPFRLVEFRPGDRRKLEAFDDYWRGAPGVKSAEYLVVPDGRTRANMIRNGEVDIARIISPTDKDALEGNKNVQLLTVPLPRYRALHLNAAKGPTADVRVRKAVAHAIRRDVLVETVLEGQGAPQVGLFRADLPWGNADLRGPEENPALARQLLEEAGYSGSNRPALTITTYATRPELPDIAQVLQQQLNEAGFDCKVEVADYTQLETAGLAGELDAVLVVRNPMTLLDPEFIYTADYASDGPNNLGQYSGADDLIARALAESDQELRYDAYRDVERRIIEEDVATVVLSSYLQVDAVRDSIEGYQPHPTDLLVLTEQIIKR